MTGLKLSNLGYRSIGLSVPDVITTLWNRSNTGLIAREASRQLSYTQQQNIVSCKTLKVHTHIIQISSYKLHKYTLQIELILVTTKRAIYQSSFLL
jgi:hypothetical protein